jgi:hypothetical protein
MYHQVSRPKFLRSARRIYICVSCGSHNTVGVHCHYHSTTARYTPSSVSFSYKKDKRAKPGNLPKSMLYRKFESSGWNSTAICLQSSAKGVCLVGGQWLAVPNTVMELRFVYRPGDWLSAFQEGHRCGLIMLHRPQASSYIESHCVCNDNESSELSRVVSVELSSQSLSSLRAASCSVLSAVSSRPPVKSADGWYYCQTVRNRSALQSLFGSAFLFLFYFLRRHFHATFEAVCTPNKLVSSNQFHAT